MAINCTNILEHVLKLRKNLKKYFCDFGLYFKKYKEFIFW